MSDPVHEMFTDAQTITAKPKDVLFRVGDEVTHVFLVEQGQVDLIRYLKTGARMMLVRSGTGQVPAEASVYSPRYHCDGVVHSAAILKKLPVVEFKRRLETDSALSNAWAANLARALQNTRMNAEIRTLRTVQDRLDAWLGDGNALPAKGHWLDLAQTLGVSREALYRELAKRR